MSVEQLIKLKEQAEQIIREKLHGEKQALLEKLEVIQRYETSATIPPVKAPEGKQTPREARAKAVPKYRDPATGATWAGRGLQPRWLRQAIASGAREEDFLIHRSDH